jgi:hypothetical protein
MYSVPLASLRKQFKIEKWGASADDDDDQIISSFKPGDDEDELDRGDA